MLGSARDSLVRALRLRSGSGPFDVLAGSANQTKGERRKAKGMSHDMCGGDGARQPTHHVAAGELPQPAHEQPVIVVIRVGFVNLQGTRARVDGPLPPSCC